MIFSPKAAAAFSLWWLLIHALIACIDGQPMTDMSSDMPSTAPSFSAEPSLLPSSSPTTVPSSVPTNVPSKMPSTEPSFSAESSFLPSNSPSTAPSSALSTLAPSVASYEHVVERLDNWTTEGGTPSKVLQLVTHHDTLLGCYTNMEEFLSPFYHTLVVLPRDVALDLHVDEIVLADSTITAGVHLFFVQPGKSGAHHARKIAEEFIAAELEPQGVDIRYLHSVLCDVHTLPAGHKQFVSMETLTLRLERDFDTVRAYRNIAGKNITTNYNLDGYPEKCFRRCSNYPPLRSMRVLAINTVLFEDVPLPTASNNDTVGKFHSNDVESWWKDGGLDRKPPELTNACLPWFMDISRTFQEHAIMFDLEALRTVKEDYFGVSPRAFTDEKSFFGKFALLNNMTVLRNNDVAFTIEFAHKSWHLNYPSDLDIDAFRNRAMEELMSHRSPYEWVANWKRANLLGVPASKPWINFLFSHMRKGQWFPSTINNQQKSVTDATTLQWLEWILLYCGYTAKGILNDNLVFEIESVYPSTRLVGYEAETYSRQLFTFQDNNNNVIDLFVDNLQRGPPDAGTVSVLQIPIAYSINRQGFHFRD